MNKKAKGSNTMGVIAVLCLVALVGIAFWYANKPVAGSMTQTTTSTGQQTTNLGVDCPSDGTTDGQVRYQDTLASTVTYGNPTVYFVAQTSGLSRITSGTLQTDGTYSTAVNLECSSAGNRYQPVAVTSQDAYASVVGETFVVAGPFVKRDIQGKAIDTLLFRVGDKVTGGAKYFNSTLSTGTQAYAAFSGQVQGRNGNLTNITNLAADTGTSLTLGTDGYIDSRIYLKTATTKKQFGEDGGRTFMLVDADGSSWSEPIVSKDNGAKLTNVASSLSEDDRRHYSGWEYAYEIGTIDDREHYVDFYIQAASGVNPAAPNYPVIEFCAEGKYNSVKSTDTIKVGCWTDAATQQPVFTNDVPAFEFIIA